jgi:hypothetical protein
LCSPSLILPLKEGEDEKRNFLPLLFFLPSSPFLRGRIKEGVFVLSFVLNPTKHNVPFFSYKLTD